MASESDSSATLTTVASSTDMIEPRIVTDAMRDVGLDAERADGWAGDGHRRRLASEPSRLAPAPAPPQRISIASPNE